MRTLGTSAQAALALALACALLGGAVPAAGAETPLALRVKAAMVYKLLPFLNSSAEHEDAGLPLRVCTLATDEFAGAIAALDGRTAGGRLLIFERIRGFEHAEGCSAVVVDDPRGAAATLDWARGRHVLTIGDSPEFAALGGMIGLVEVDGTVKFEVNLATARAAGWAIDSRLLQLARRVYRTSDAGGPP